MQKESLINTECSINININTSTDQTWVFDCLIIVCLHIDLPRNVGILEMVMGIPLSGKNCSDVINTQMIVSAKNTKFLKVC